MEHGDTKEEPELLSSFNLKMGQDSSSKSPAAGLLGSEMFKTQRKHHPVHVLLRGVASIKFSQLKHLISFHVQSVPAPLQVWIEQPTVFICPTFFIRQKKQLLNSKLLSPKFDSVHLVVAVLGFTYLDGLSMHRDILAHYLMFNSLINLKLNIQNFKLRILAKVKKQL